MRRMGRLLSGGLAAGMLLAALSGCTVGVPKKKPQVHLVFKVPTLAMSCVVDRSVKEAYEVFEKATADFTAQYTKADVTFDLVKFDLAEENTYISECFDTEQAADILYEDYFNMSTYVHTGRVVPLDDAVSDAVRADIDDSYWKMSKVEGRTYMMPYLARQNVLGYHRSMLRAAGLAQYVSDDDSTIQSWTLAQWDEILSALHANLPQSSFALAMYAGNEQGDTHTMTWLRSHGSSFFDAEGNVSLETPEGIAALQWLKDNYDKGYYPPACENMTIRDCGKLFWNNQLAIKMVNGPSDDANDPDVGLVNFPSADGAGYATTFVTGFEIFDNGDAAKVEAAKDFLRYFYGSELYMDYSAGNIPVSNRVAQKYESRIGRLEAFRSNSGHVVDFMNNSPNWRGVRAVFYRDMQELFLGTKTPEQTAQELDADCNTAIAEGRAESRLHP